MSDEIGARCTTHHHACDCREAAHTADRDRLRRLVAAVRRASETGALDCVGSCTTRTPPEEQCATCELVAELEACEAVQ
jgi:hypothetical protein